MADETAFVPLSANGRNDDLVQHILFTALAARRRATGMAVETPCKTVLLHKRGLRVEGITALGAEEMADVPFGTTGNHHLAFNRGLAALTAGAEEFMEVQVAVEPRDVGFFVMGWCICQSLRTTGFGFLVESHAFERRLAVETGEAFWMEPRASCGYNSSRDSK